MNADQVSAGELGAIDIKPGEVYTVTPRLTDEGNHEWHVILREVLPEPEQVAHGEPATVRRDPATGRPA